MNLDNSSFLLTSDLLTLILLIVAAIYGMRVGFFMIGFHRERAKWKSTFFDPLVSVVVPARNEEATIERCVEALMRLDYPTHRLEVIVVNDRSTDRTDRVLRDLSHRYPTLRVLERADVPSDRNLRGKPGALQQGIEASHGDIILMTDADCRVSPGWVRGMVNQFLDPAVGLVAGLTSVTGPTLFDTIQDVEWTFTQAMAAGGVGWGVPLGCFGNNLAVRRTAFNSVGGYREISFSVTEDLALQQALHDAGWQVRHAFHETTSVETLPAHSLAEYITQRHRWVRGGTSLGLRAVMFVGSSLALWAGLVVSSWFGMWSWFGVLLLLRVMADGSLIAMAGHAVRRYHIIPYIPIAVLVLMATELFLPFLVLKKSVTWKSQVFRP